MTSQHFSPPSGASDGQPASEVQPGELLHSGSSCYSVQRFIGVGGFGKVARCINMATKEIVAIKILMPIDKKRGLEEEVHILEHIKVLNPEQSNTIKYIERFQHKGQTCLVFEMLDKEMFQFLEEQEWKPLSLSEIRPIAHQLFVALDSLKGLGVLHADIRPENIMLVNKQDQPLRVKLIDFGEAVLASNVQPGMMLQPCGFRAPEVALGLPFDEAIDVWGVGCMLAFLYITDSIFTVCCIYQMMKDIVSILGQPPDHLLHAGKYTCDFFEAEEAADGTTWRLMTPEEFQVATNKVPQESNRVIGPLSSLDDLVNFYPKGDVAEFEDRKTFVDLMKQLLHIDGIQRISPREALHHPFISMAHLAVNPDCRNYLTTSQAMMAVCQKDSSSQPDQDAAATDAPPATDSRDVGPTTDPSDGVLVESSNGEPTAAMSSDGASKADTSAASSSFTRYIKTKFKRIWRRVRAGFCCCF